MDMAKKIGVTIAKIALGLAVIACFFFGFLIWVTMSIPDYKYICGGGYECRIGFNACESTSKEEQYECFKSLAEKYDYANNFDNKLRCTKFGYLAN